MGKKWLWFSVGCRRGVAVAAALLFTATGCHAPTPTEHTKLASVSDQSTNTSQPKNANPPASPQALPTCQATSLTATIDSTRSGAGHTIHTVRMTNNQSRCTMYGYPGVSLTDDTGSQLGSAAEREHADTPENVTLDTGESVHFAIQITNAMMIDEDVCKPTTTATTLKIYPPNDTGFLTLPVSNTPTCTNDKVPVLSTGAVHPG